MDSYQTYDHDSCAMIAKNLGHLKNLPMQCMKYSDVKMDLQRRDTDSTDQSSLLS